MENIRSKKPVYAYLGVSLFLLAVCLLLILWVKDNTALATRLAAEQLVVNGSGYELMTNEAAETYVIGDYTARVARDGITLLSARGEERAYFETELRDPYVLQDGEMLVAGSKESRELYVLNRNGDYYRAAVSGEVVGAFGQNDKLLGIAELPDEGAVLQSFDLNENTGSEIYRLEPGEEPMRARFAPDGRTIDLLVQPVYGGVANPYLLRLSPDGEILQRLDIPAGDLYVDFHYLPDGRIGILGSSHIVVTDVLGAEVERHLLLDNTAGLWQVAGRLIALAGNDTSGFALYTLTDQAERLLDLPAAPTIMPAISETYGVFVTETELQLFDVRGARMLETFPLTQRVHRVEFTGPTSFLVIADRGVYPFAVQ